MKTCIRTKIFRSGIIVLLLGLLLNCSSVFSQSLTGVTWQLQNPTVSSYSVMVVFDTKGRYLGTTVDLKTGQSAVEKGTYTLEGNDLTLTINRSDFTCKVILKNSDQMTVIFNGRYSYYSRYNSPSDQFLKNYNASTYYDHHDDLDRRDVPAKSAPQTCYTCFGTGRCKICSGSGRSPGMYGQPSSPCSACGSTGKCWHCYGSGKQ